MSKTRSKKEVNTAVIIALIGLVGTVIAALISSPLLLKLFERQPIETVITNGNNVLVFSEDFEDGTTSGFGFSDDNWTIGKDKSNNVLVADTTVSQAYAICSFGPTDFSNGMIEFKIKYEELGGFYTVFRLKDMAEYIFYLTPHQAILGYNSKAQDWKMTPFGDDSIKSISIQTGIWYPVQIEIQGTNIAAYFDGNRLFTGEDSRLQKGSLQFNMDEGTKVMLDDVKVWSSDR